MRCIKQQGHTASRRLPQGWVRSALRLEGPRCCLQQRASSCQLTRLWAGCQQGSLAPAGAGCAWRGVGRYAQEGSLSLLVLPAPRTCSPHSTGIRHGRCPGEVQPAQQQLAALVCADMQSCMCRLRAGDQPGYNRHAGYS
jgi:hypothetical protein